MISKGLRVGAVQLCATDDVSRNLDTCEDLVRRAVDAGAELVVLPENFAFIGRLERTAEMAEDLAAPADQPVLGRMAGLARQVRAWLLLGGTPTRAAEPGRFFNTAVLLSPDGEVRASYRKLHLFDIDIPGGPVFEESSTVTAGHQVVTAPLAETVLGLTICYDLRFPELYRSLTEKGMEVCLVPAAFTLHTGRDHWLPLLRARAIENQVYVVAAAQYGWHSPRRASYGRTCVVDPWGVVLGQLPDREGSLVIDLDLDYLRRVRRELPCLQHRRIALET